MPKKPKSASAEALVALVKAAAAESADYQERFAAEDIEARKIVSIMETFLRQDLHLNEEEAVTRQTLRELMAS